MSMFKRRTGDRIYYAIPARHGCLFTADSKILRRWEHPAEIKGGGTWLPAQVRADNLVGLPPLPIPLLQEELDQLGRGKAHDAATAFGPAAQDKFSNQDYALSAGFVGAGRIPYSFAVVADGVSTRTLWPERSSRIAALTAFKVTRRWVARMVEPFAKQTILEYRRTLTLAIRDALAADRSLLTRLRLVSPAWDAKIYGSAMEDDSLWYNTTLLVACLGGEQGLLTTLGDGGAVLFRDGEARERKVVVKSEDSLEIPHSVNLRMDDRQLSVAQVGLRDCIAASVVLSSDGIDRTIQRSGDRLSYEMLLQSDEAGRSLQARVTAQDLIELAMGCDSAELDNMSVAVARAPGRADTASAAPVEPAELGQYDPDEIVSRLVALLPASSAREAWARASDLAQRTSIQAQDALEMRSAELEPRQEQPAKADRTPDNHPLETGRRSRVTTAAAAAGAVATVATAGFITGAHYSSNPQAGSTPGPCAPTIVSHPDSRPRAPTASGDARAAAPPSPPGAPPPARHRRTPPSPPLPVQPPSARPASGAGRGPAPEVGPPPAPAPAPAAQPPASPVPSPPAAGHRSGVSMWTLTLSATRAMARKGVRHGDLAARHLDGNLHRDLMDASQMTREAFQNVVLATHGPQITAENPCDSQVADHVLAQRAISSVLSRQGKAEDQLALLQARCRATPALDHLAVRVLAEAMSDPVSQQIVARAKQALVASHKADSIVDPFDLAAAQIVGLEQQAQRRIEAIALFEEAVRRSPSYLVTLEARAWLETVRSALHEADFAVQGLPDEPTSHHSPLDLAIAKASRAVRLANEAHEAMSGATAQVRADMTAILSIAESLQSKIEELALI